jgi:alpha-tubulin suppressor-like RCC1 family protein
MRNTLKSLVLSLLMIGLSFSVAPNAFTETSHMNEVSEPMNVILPLAELNDPGFQEGSVFTDTALSSGGVHTCVLLDNGRVSCWGKGNYGQLGNGNSGLRYSPTLISSLGDGRTALALSTGNHHTCAILDDGSVSCWGRNTQGQLGNGGTSNSLTPTPTSDLGPGRTAVAITSGAYYTCVILDNASVSCWGLGSTGQLGNGGTSQQNSPTLTSSFGVGRNPVAISAGWSHTCVLLDDGSVSCWGNNNYGTFGDGSTTNQNSPTPSMNFGAGRTAVAITSGDSHTCAILDDGNVSCWGGNYKGQLGDGSTTDRNTPGLTNSLGVDRRAVSLSSGGTHTCAILDNGDVSCWGDNSNGKLGLGSSAEYSANPTVITESQASTSPNLRSGRTAVGISSGSQHTCAVLNMGEVSCWGIADLGQLGNGEPPSWISSRSRPVRTDDLGSGHFSALSERDFDDDDILNIFENSNNDTDGDGFIDIDDVFLNNPYRSVACSAGQYGRYVCIDAPAGKFVSSTGAMFATSADAGYYVNSTLGTGQTNQTACPEGTFNPNKGSSISSDCIQAEQGHFIELSQGPAQSSQSQCPTGTFNPNSGSTSSSDCINADAGHYVSALGQSSQTPCLNGTYNPNTGSTNSSDCLNADPGYYVSVSGQSEQTPCSPGTYNPENGSSICYDADEGFYVSTSGQFNQTPCPSEAITVNKRSTNISECIQPFELPMTYISESAAKCNIDTLRTPDSPPGFEFNNSNGTSYGLFEELMDGKKAVVVLFYADWDSHSTRYLDTNVLQDLSRDYSDDFTVVFWQADGLSTYGDNIFNADNSASDISTFGINGFPIILAFNPTGLVINIQDQGMRFQENGAAFTDVEGMAADLALWSEKSQNQVDDDGDGFPNHCDFFEDDPNEWNDSDWDGIGDNSDAFPNNIYETMDSDGDGVGDNSDAFPNNASETMDSDGDGVGDNSDLFPNNASETMDSDGDGVGDNSDAFPNNASETIDSDGDGVGDNLDISPFVPDADQDGWEDIIEEECQTDPFDATSIPADLNFNDYCDYLEGYVDLKEQDVEDESDVFGDVSGTIKNSLPIAGTLLAVIVGLVVVLKVVSKLRSDDEDWGDEEFDFYDEASDTKKTATARELILPAPQPLLDFVETWEELPDGDWLENDEHGVHWYLDNDGNHWYSTDDGYRIFVDKN